MDNLLVYLLLKISMIISGIFCGHICSKEKRYFPYILLFIVIFLINEGLRFGRGVDYNSYYFKYHDILTFSYLEAKEFFFIAYCKSIDFVGLNYKGFIFSLSLILICSCLYSLRNYKKILPFALPLFCFYSIGAENLIRWWMAFSFIMVAVSYATEQKWKQSLIFILIGCLFHYAILIVVAIMGGLYLIKKPITNIAYIWGTYILVYLFFKPEYMDYISQYSNLLQFSNSFQYTDYIRNATDWLNGTANYEAGTLSFMLAIQDLLVLYVAKVVVKNHPNLNVYYNFCLFGTLLYPAFYQIEILWRIIDLFHFYQYFILAVALYDIVYKKNKVLYNNNVITASTLIIVNLIRMHIVNYLFEYNENSILFIWDAAGRNYLI